MSPAQVSNFTVIWVLVNFVQFSPPKSLISWQEKQLHHHRKSAKSSPPNRSCHVFLIYLIDKKVVKDYRRRCSVNVRVGLFYSFSFYCVSCASFLFLCLWQESEEVVVASVFRRPKVITKVIGGIGLERCLLRAWPRSYSCVLLLSLVCPFRMCVSEKKRER